MDVAATISINTANGGISQAFTFSDEKKFLPHNLKGVPLDDGQIFESAIRLVGCGYVLYKKYIICFGGWINKQFIDTIYLLNLETNSGWMEVKNAKCPMKSSYRAVLATNNDIHLFTTVNQKPYSQSVVKHYAISIGEILGGIANDNNDDMKCGDNEHNELAQKYSKLNKENKEIKSKLDYQHLITKKCQQQIQQLTKEKNKYLEENKSLIHKLRMSELENMNLNEECKEKLSELEQIKKELNTLKRLSDIDTNRYREWSSDEVVDWLISLEKGKYQKYEQMLRVIFNKEGVNGEGIESINQSELGGWGVQSFMDRANITKRIQLLVNKNKNQNANNNNDDDEGDK